MRGYGVVAFLAAVGMVATGCERWFTAPRGEEESAIRTDRQAYMVGSGEPDFRYAFDLVAVFDGATPCRARGRVEPVRRDTAQIAGRG